MNGLAFFLSCPVILQKKHDLPLFVLLSAMLTDIILHLVNIVQLKKNEYGAFV